MRTFNRYANAARVVALCLPPVIMSLAGLAALSRKPRPANGAEATVAREDPPAPRRRKSAADT